MFSHVCVSVELQGEGWWWYPTSVPYYFHWPHVLSGVYPSSSHKYSHWSYVTSRGGFPNQVRTGDTPARSGPRSGWGKGYSGVLTRKHRMGCPQEQLCFDRLYHGRFPARGHCYYINFIIVFSSQVQIMVGSKSQSNPGTVYQLSDIRTVGCILFYTLYLLKLKCKPILIFIVIEIYSKSSEAF